MVKFVYDLVFKSTVNLWLNIDLVIGMDALVAITFLCLAPFASFVADVKFGRFKTLVYSTYVIIISNSIFVVGVCGFFAVQTFNYLFYIFATITYIGLLASLSGMIFFLCNVIQFGTDQLRDSPTKKSVLFLYAIYWCNNISNFLTLCISIPGKRNRDNRHLNIFYVDKLKSSLMVTACGCFVTLSILVVFIVHKKKHWLLTEHLGSNPYLLTWRVVKFAAQHNKPIRRSAFTYCESDSPSRLDFGKQRYGGPFTTEQVEDIKTLLNILKVLLCLDPAFFLEQCTIHRHYQSSNNSKEQLFDGVVSTAISFVFIPVLMKYFMSRCFPSMFKRMGFGIACLLLIFLLYILYSAVSTGDIISSGSCKNGTEISDYFISHPVISIWSLESVIHFIFRLLVYISVWEFICFFMQYELSTSY